MYKLPNPARVQLRTCSATVQAQVAELRNLALTLGQGPEARAISATATALEAQALALAGLEFVAEYAQ